MDFLAIQKCIKNVNYMKVVYASVAILQTEFKSDNCNMNSPRSMVSYNEEHLNDNLKKHLSERVNIYTM